MTLEESELELPEDDSGQPLPKIAVSLPVFEGPLDLLLHLIRKHQIDIFDIPVAKILDEYLATLELMRSLNLDVAGEFLVMASTLAQIKSRMLLPPDGQPEEERPPEEQDPRAELVRRLLEYQKYKEAAEQLQERLWLGRDVFSRPHSGEDDLPLPADEAPPYRPVSVFHLIEALDVVLHRASRTIDHEILIERISVAGRIHELVELLQQKPQTTFLELLAERPTRTQIVVTFLALLEMARLKLVSLQQPQDSEVIYILSRVEKADLSQALASLDYAGEHPREEASAGKKDNS